MAEDRTAELEARIAELEARLKKYEDPEYSRLATEQQRIEYIKKDLRGIVDEIWDEIERGGWEPGGKAWNKYCH